MELETGEMPTLAAAVSELGLRGDQGTLDTIVRKGIARKDAPTFCGKCAPNYKIDAIFRTGIAREEAVSEGGRRSCDSRRICTISCATEKCKNTVQQIGGYCGPCHNLVPKNIKAEFCIGVGGRLCGRKIERVNQCRKCYYDPEEKKMREAKKAAVPTSIIDGCRGNEVRSYGLCQKHYKQSERAKAEMKLYYSISA